MLANRVGVSVPLLEDFVAAGGYEDLSTDSEVGDEVAEIAAANATRGYLDVRKRLVAKRGGKTEEESVDKDDEEEEDGMGRVTKATRTARTARTAKDIRMTKVTCSKGLTRGRRDEG